MKKGPEFLFLVVFAVCIAFFACTEQKTQEEEMNANSSSDIGSYSSSFDSPDYSSDSQNQEVSSSGGEVANDGSSGSQDQNSAGSSSSVSASISSSSALGISSSSSHIPQVTDPGANCAYQPSWCGGITFDKVKTASMNETDVGAEDKGQERPNCIYATAITQIGNESGGISINGTTFASGNASRCGGDSGSGWGDATACATKFASVAKVDGGYYIYVPAWAGQNFKTTGGQPVCSGTSTPGTSSPSTASSSSVAASTSTCVEPMYGLPPSGVTSCIKKNNKCYTCNPDRGKECEQAWIWQANSIDDYWYKEVSCSETSGGGTTYNLTCTGLAQNGVTGTAITQPTVKCNGDNASATFASAPNWSNPVAGTFNVTATANCGGNKTVSCGTITVSAPTASTLTCSGLGTTGVAGTAITQPTVKCGSTTVSNPAFTGAPTWTNPTAGSYTVKANATGACTQTADCGTIKVNPKLTCGNPSPASVTAGTAVTAPTVTCGTTTVAAANISWSGQPTYWSAPDAGTYNNIRATANSGDCSGQTATCGTLTVGSKLTCDAVTQAITTGQTPTKPKVACGSTNVTSGITWSPTSINGAINTAGTITGVTATASCGGSNQTATCSGTITVTAQQTTPSSSSTGGGSYTPKPAGNQSGQTTQYWDACKPSCSWSGKGGLQANSCDISGKNIGHNDGDRSACDGGNAFTCMNQAPWKVGNISYGYVAINDGACGDCYQLDFPNGAVMVAMKSNIGSINGKFDIMIPGGGVGDFDALTRQVTNSGVSVGQNTMGERYGGFRGACGWSYSTSNVNCVKQKCEEVFKNLPDLKAGCLWYVNTLGTDEASWNNPNVKYQKVDCPAELKNKY